MNSLLLLSSLAMAEPSEYIVVEASRDIVVYVKEPLVVYYKDNTQYNIIKDSPYVYATAHWKNAKVDSGKGYYENILKYTKINVYDKDTIEYVFDNCDYKENPHKCSYDNNYYTLETTVTVDDFQVATQMVLYDENMRVASQSTVSVRGSQYWIKQQDYSATNSVGLLQNTIAVNKPKEELPIRWVIPITTTDNHIHQASLMLWQKLMID